MMPDQVHFGQADAIHEARQKILNLAYAANPERFVKKPPTPPNKPTTVWINPPTRKTQSKENAKQGKRKARNKSERKFETRLSHCR